MLTWRKRISMVLAVSIFLLMTMSFLPRPSIVFASEEKMTLVSWNWETEEKWNHKLEGSGFSEAFPNVKVTFVSLPYADLHTKFMTLLMSGVKKGLPDIVRISPSQASGFINLGAITDVTDRITPLKDKIPNGTWQEIHHTDGRIYKIPDDFIIDALAYRWDIFEEAGLPSDPKEVEELFSTWDNVIEAGKKLKSLGVDTITVDPTGGGWFGMFPMMGNQDTTGFFDRYGNLIFDSPYHVQVAEIIKRIWDAGIAYKDEMGTPVYWENIKEGKIAISYYPQYFDFILLDFAPETAKKWRAVKFPAIIPGGRRLNSFDSCSLVIPKILDDDRKDMAWNYCVYMNLSTKGQLAHMETFPGACSSWLPALEIMKDKPSPILDNQNTYGLFLSWLDQEGIRTRIEPEAYNRANEAATKAMYEILHDKKSAEVALKEAANKLRAELERERKR